MSRRARRSDRVAIELSRHLLPLVFAVIPTVEGPDPSTGLCLDSARWPTLTSVPGTLARMRTRVAQCALAVGALLLTVPSCSSTVDVTSPEPGACGGSDTKPILKGESQSVTVKVARGQIVGIVAADGRMWFPEYTRGMRHSDGRWLKLPDNLYTTTVTKVSDRELVLSLPQDQNLHLLRVGCL